MHMNPRGNRHDPDTQKAKPHMVLSIMTAIQTFLDNPIIKRLGSLRLSLWLLGAQAALFIAGAVAMPLMKEYGMMNSMALLDWMRQAPVSASWWLWASLPVIALLALNTLVCSLEAILSRKGRSFYELLAPQVVHLGFLFMMAAHLVSSAGAMHLQRGMQEGAMIRLPDENIVRLAKVDMEISPEGFPLNWSARLEYYSPTGDLIGKDISAPNSPSFFGEYGIYIKQPARGGAIMEVHREPGGPVALIGSVLFLLGTVALVRIKIRREQ